MTTRPTVEGVSENLFESAVEALGDLADYAYKNGYHEFGYDPVQVVIDAREAASQQLADVLTKDRLKTSEINILTAENRKQTQQLAEMREALERIAASHGASDHSCSRRGIADAALERFAAHEAVCKHPPDSVTWDDSDKLNAFWRCGDCLSRIRYGEVDGDPLDISHPVAYPASPSQPERGKCAKCNGSRRVLVDHGQQRDQYEQAC